MRHNDNYVKISIALTLLAAIVGCNKRLNEQYPTTTLADVNFWKTPNDLAIACNYLYSYLPGLNYQSDPVWGGNISTAPGVPPMQEFMGSDGFGSAVNVISDGSWVTPTGLDEWNKNYQLIRAANNIMEHAVTVTGDQGLINKYLGEAHFFRAWGYFQLVKRFGDVPLILQTLSVTDTLLYSPRVSRQIVLDTIYSDLNIAAASCPAASTQTPAEYGRITRSAALAFESRVGLFEGTYEKYHGVSGGDPTKHLQIALTAATTVMNEGQHSLFTISSATSYSSATLKDSSYYFLFQYPAWGFPVPATPTLAASLAVSPSNSAITTGGYYATNKENILVKLYGVNSGTSVLSQNFPVGINQATNQMFITKHLLDQYLYKDGLPGPNGGYGVNKSAYSVSDTSSIAPFINRDPRASMTIFNRLIPAINNVSATTIGYYSPLPHYYTRKWINAADNSLNRSYLSYSVIRYAEVLLNYAEATYELNGSISDADLEKTINLLRQRANPSGTEVSNDFLHLKNAFVAAHGLNMLTEIRREREIELAMEGFHYWDLLRWKTAEVELPQDALGPRYFPKEMGTNLKLNLNQDSVIIYETNRTFPAKNYLWPIPTLQIALTGKDASGNNILTQNPGWGN